MNIFKASLIVSRLWSGDSRSLKYKKNTILLVVFQGLSLIISMALIRMVLNSLGIEEYGVWVTLTTIITWFTFFDVGLGNGLRNKYAMAKAQGDYKEIKYYVSTTFFLLIIISSAIFLLFLIGNIFFNWAVLLAAPKRLTQELNLLLLIMSGIFCVGFVVNIVTILLTADQNPAIPALLNLLGGCLSLVGVYWLIKTSNTSLLSLGICLSFIQVLPQIIAYFVFFGTRFKEFKPNLKFFNLAYTKSIFSTGIRFFLIQITALVLYQTNNIIIAHTCGVDEVAKFNISYKYLSVLYIFFITILKPMWSASTEAFTRGEFDWIKKWILKLKLIWWVLVFVGILMVIFSSYIYEIWLSSRVSPNYVMLGLVLIYLLSLTRTSIYRYFINGIGKIKLQFYVTTAQAILHVPLALIMANFFGVSGILLAMICWNLINTIWEPIQFKKIINYSAKGIWNS